MSRPEIESYQFGHIVIDGQIYERDLIILPGGVREGWWRQEGHSLHPQDLTAVFEARPEVLVVGQGAYQMMQIPDQTRQKIEAAGIQLVAAGTEAACQTYNELREQQDVAAALHLTC